MKLLQTAKLDPTRDTPTSLEFGDIYFSPADGIGESRYHFIDGNNLSLRFPIHLRNHQAFTVAETGFGTGLNCLLTAELWQQCALALPTSHQTLPTLQFISTEKYPIAQARLAEIYQQQGWHKTLTETLISQYPSTPYHGVYTLMLSTQPAPVELTLLLGDAVDSFNAYDFCADAWFLDGFAPAKNPDLWSQALYKIMAARSRSGTTFATFTAASTVRRGLLSNGFTVQKSKGFGRKRERLLGSFGSCMTQ